MARTPNNLKPTRRTERSPVSIPRSSEPMLDTRSSDHAASRSSRALLPLSDTPTRNAMPNFKNSTSKSILEPDDAYQNAALILGTCGCCRIASPWFPQEPSTTPKRRTKPAHFRSLRSQSPIGGPARCFPKSIQHTPFDCLRSNAQTLDAWYRVIRKLPKALSELQKMPAHRHTAKEVSIIKNDCLNVCDSMAARISNVVKNTGQRL